MKILLVTILLISTTSCNRYKVQVEEPKQIKEVHYETIKKRYNASGRTIEPEEIPMIELEK